MGKRSKLSNGKGRNGAWLASTTSEDKCVIVGISRVPFTSLSLARLNRLLGVYHPQVGIGPSTMDNEIS